jgi:hypothetical protein
MIISALTRFSFSSNFNLKQLSFPGPVCNISFQITMDFMNTTYMAAASLLPQAMPKGSSSHAFVGPSMISLDPWSVFEKLWTGVVGYPAKDFQFTQGSTPMSTLKETLCAITLYYTIIFGGREIMRNREAFKLNTLFIIHNFYLTAISGGLLLLFAQQLIPTLWRNGLYDNICGASGWTQPLTVLYFLNYLTKYLELLDTVFLVLKKKPLTFLHTYHHGATALLCYTQLLGHTSVSWVPITLNLTVHVVMYWYYFQTARGVKVWWKQYITMLQISQFVLDLGKSESILGITSHANNHQASSTSRHGTTSQVSMHHNYPMSAHALVKSLLRSPAAPSSALTLSFSSDSTSIPTRRSPAASQAPPEHKKLSTAEAKLRCQLAQRQCRH